MTGVQPGRMVALLLFCPAARAGICLGYLTAGWWIHSALKPAAEHTKPPVMRSQSSLFNSRRALPDLTELLPSRASASASTSHLMSISPVVVPGAPLLLLPLASLALKVWFFFLWYKKWKWITPGSTKRGADCSTRQGRFSAATFPPWWLTTALWPPLRMREASSSWGWSR